MQGEGREDEGQPTRATFSQKSPDPYPLSLSGFAFPFQRTFQGVQLGLSNDLRSNGFTQLRPALPVSYRLLQWAGIDSASTARSAKLQEQEISAMRFL